MLSGALAICAGAAFLFFGYSGGSEAANDLNPKRHYLNGQVEIGGRQYEFKYCRYAEPLVMLPGFRCAESLSKSPLHTLLSMNSWQNAEDYKTAAGAYLQPAQYLRDIDEWKEMVASGKMPKERWERESVLGEVIYREVTVVVARLVPKNKDAMVHVLGTCFVKRGDKYLHDGTAKERYRLLRELSADRYSIITGKKE